MWPSSTASSNTGGWSFPGLSFLTCMCWILKGHSLHISGALCVCSFLLSTTLSYDHWLPCFPWLHSISLVHGLLCFICLDSPLCAAAWKLSPDRKQSNGGAHLVFCLSGCTVLHCLGSSVLKLLLPIVFVYFLVVSGRKVELIPLLLLGGLLDLWARQREMPSQKSSSPSQAWGRGVSIFGDLFYLIESHYFILKAGSLKSDLSLLFSPNASGGNKWGKSCKIPHLACSMPRGNIGPESESEIYTLTSPASPPHSHAWFLLCKAQRFTQYFPWKILVILTPSSSSSFPKRSSWICHNRFLGVGVGCHAGVLLDENAGSWGQPTLQNQNGGMRVICMFITGSPRGPWEHLGIIDPNPKPVISFQELQHLLDVLSCQAILLSFSIPTSWPLCSIITIF